MPLTHTGIGISITRAGLRSSIRTPKNIPLANQTRLITRSAAVMSDFKQAPHKLLV
jgi:hypothetical protein